MQLTERNGRRLGWALSGLVIAFMLLDGALKLIPLDVVLKSSAEIGFPPTAMVARELGALGILCTILYAIPRTSILGAILLTAYLGGTAAAHFRIGNPLLTHILFGVYVAVLAWGGIYLRDNRLRAIFPFCSACDDQK